MARPKLDLVGAANAGMQAYARKIRLERDEEATMKRMAAAVTSEAQFQKILDDVDPAMRDAVESRVRPHLKFKESDEPVTEPPPLSSDPR